MFKDKFIVCISTISWDFLLQRHQIIMQKFAQNGNKIVYIENINPSFNFKLSIIFKIIKRLTMFIFKVNKTPKTNIEVISPFILPFKDKVSDFINRQLLLKILARKIAGKLNQPPIIWTYLATTNTLSLIKDLTPEFLIYDCVFDAQLHPNSPKDIKESEEKLIKSSNLVLTDNQLLFNRCKAFNKNTHLIHPGVNFESFTNLISLKEPTELKEIAHPRLCFFGGIDAIRIDLKLINYIAREKPDWNIVLFGPVINTDISLLKSRNIHFMGILKYKELPAYLNFMDVFILPYKLKPFTRSLFPAKIFECLASGKPIVSTPLEELTKFKDAIMLANLPEDFINCIEKALRYDTQEDINKRLAIAMNNSWDKRFDDICELIITEYRLNKNL